MDRTASTEARSSAAIPNESPIGTLERGLFLLGLFDADHPEWSLKELRERADLPKATTRRLMKTLESSLWVTYDPSIRKYHLGASALRMVYLAGSHSEFVRITHPFLVRLEEETTESCSLSVWTDLGALILDTVPTTRHFKPLTYRGMIVEGIVSADAQVLIAFGPEEAWDALLAKPIEPRTEKTITDPELLRERWRTVRREGVSFDRGEWKLEAPAVAAPVFGQLGELRGSISVVPPLERASEREMQKYAEAAKATAAGVSKLLG